MTDRHAALYDRLPEIYRIWDEEQSGPTPLRAFLEVIEQSLEAVDTNIDELYHDLFIETCNDWVVPYIADLIGTSHLSGDPWTIRADVADTIALRRRKGTLGALEQITYNITGWAPHATELFTRITWAQHLNHQRDDNAGRPLYDDDEIDRFTVPRGGFAPIRAPGTCSLIGTPHDPFAHTADVRPPATDAVRYNVPNVAIFLWRLEPYSIPLVDPVFRSIETNGVATADAAPFIVRFDAHQLGRPLQLFNRFEADFSQMNPLLVDVDRTPGPMHEARLDSGSPAGHPEAYVSVTPYDDGDISSIVLQTDTGLCLYVPRGEFEPFEDVDWFVRGTNLCAWEEGIRPELRINEIAIDPAIGRIVIGVESQAQAEALRDGLKLSVTDAAVGPVGAHPIARTRDWDGEALPAPIVVDRQPTSPTLEEALADLPSASAPVHIEIADSRVHDLDLNNVIGVDTTDADAALRLASSLVIRAADGERPIIRLARPLRFRVDDVDKAENIVVRLEGLFITSDSAMGADEALIERAAVGTLEIYDSTLDPGGHEQLDGTRADIRSAMRLTPEFGFTDASERDDFDETPRLHIDRSVTGPVLTSPDYELVVADSIVDAGGGLGDDPAGPTLAIGSAAMPIDSDWGPDLTIEGATIFGQVRVAHLQGSGAIILHRLEVFDHQSGCIEDSWLSGAGDLTPPTRRCVNASDARLLFTSETHGHPAYAQLALDAASAIRAQGPQDDQMGAFGFLLEAHRWSNLRIRVDEFMPVGSRPLFVTVT